jgi:carbohydrate-binding DOMON domain-containing protein
MEKTLIIVLVLITVSLFAESLLKLEDPVGDDHGNGKVLYPDNPMFDERIFDLLSMEISSEGDDYLISLEVAGKIMPVEHAEFQYSYDLPDDFILPLIHIYIDKDHINNSGFTETIFGTNVLLDTESAWEKVVVIASMPDRYYGEMERLQPEIARSTVIAEKISLSRDKKTIIVKIPRLLLGDITEDWGFAILMMSQEFSQNIRKNIYIREVNATASQYNFGGGESNITKDYDPNIIDLIVPLGKEQKFLLNSYNKEAKEYAVIPAVYPNRSGVKGEALAGEVKQVTDKKVVINLGSENGIEPGTELIIDNTVVVIAEDVFPQLTIAVYGNDKDWENVELGMNVTILNK